jgi:hypothetical protein
MLQRLSYFNLFLAVVYLVVYLRNSTLSAVAGILVIIIINWLCLLSFEKDDYKWAFWHYLISIGCLYFIGTLGYGLINIISASVEFDFITIDNLIYVTVTFALCVSVILQLILYFLAHRKAII